VRILPDNAEMYPKTKRPGMFAWPLGWVYFGNLSFNHMNGFLGLVGSIFLQTRYGSRTISAKVG
jgi:hypothetical protein